jgi:hypothetical protein
MTGAELRALAVRLRAEYPEWTIAVTQGHYGDRLAAYRSAGAGRLVALITTDPAELRRELDAAASSRM